MVIYVDKKDNGIIPSKRFEDQFDKLKNGTYKAELTQPRDSGYHKKFMAFLNYLYGIKQCTFDIDFDSFRKEVVRLAGFVEPYRMLNGEMRYPAKSISFAKMDQEELTRLFSKTIDVGLSYFITPDMEDSVRIEAENIILGFDG